jgi:glycerol-3-phosphate dehydrogenase
MYGATIVNYVEAVGFLKEDPKRKELITGAVVVDRETQEKFNIKAKSVLFCGGPFTDELRKMENTGGDGERGEMKEAVTGASGIHIILPSYYNNTGKNVFLIMFFPLVFINNRSLRHWNGGHEHLGWSFPLLAPLAGSCVDWNH